MRKSTVKGFKVSKTKSGKTVLEPIATYGKSVSQRIASRKKVRVSRKAPG